MENMVKNLNDAMKMDGKIAPIKSIKIKDGDKKLKIKFQKGAKSQALKNAKK